MTELEMKNENKKSTDVEKKHKKKSAVRAYSIILAFVFVVCSICAIYQLSNTVSTKITINAALAESGKKPDGTSFSILEIFSDDVMERAVDKLNGKIEVEELRKHLSVTDAMSDESFGKLEESIHNQQYDNTYFPTEYLLTYSTLSEQIRQEGFFAQCKALFGGLFSVSKTKILNAVVESYQECYAEEYLEYDALININWDEVDNMDYYTRLDYMKNTVERLTRFLQYKNNQSLSNSNTNSGMGFSDLLTELSYDTLNSIENGQAYVIQNGVTKDRAELLRQFKNMQKFYEEENIHYLHTHSVLKKTIDMYDSTTTKVLFIPSLDGNGEFYMNRTKIGLDYLIEQAEQAKINADEAAHTAEYYSYLQDSFGERYVIDQDQNQTAANNTKQQKEYADKAYSTLKAEISNLLKDLEDLLSKSQEDNSEGIFVASACCRTSLVSVGASFAKRMVLLFIAVAFVFDVTKFISKKAAKKDKRA